MTELADRRLLALAPNADRIQYRLDTLAKIGGLDGGGCCRLAFTDDDRRGRDLVASWMRDVGLDVVVDRIGNIVGVTPGRDGEAPIMMGSHIDTVATGGRYDGNLGVIAGLDVIETLKEAGISTDRPLALVVFSNEEGVRFQPDMMGSLVYAGALKLDEALAVTDGNGRTVAADLNAIGYLGDAPVGAVKPHAFVELHIEQGPVLDRAGEVLGVVENLQGIAWHELIIKGVSNHAGTTPMEMRHDAAFVAAEITTFVRRLASEIGRGQVATVGSIHLHPNLVNVIARDAKITVDLRHTDDALLAEAEHRLFAFIDNLAREEGVTIDRRELVRTQPVIFSPYVTGMIRQAAERRGMPVRSMTSGAGHDAQMISTIAPTAMIFIPSRDGISHNPREYTEPAHIAIGAQILLDTVVALANDHTGIQA
jgi:N-carbamoyl-L-amino-acid hydrolase